MSTEVEDYSSRAAKRRRVDVGVPRGTNAHHQAKTNGSAAYATGAIENADVLRTLLKNNKKVKNGSVTPPCGDIGGDQSPLTMSQFLQAKAKEMEEFDIAMEANDRSSDQDEVELSSDELETMDGSANDASAIPDRHLTNRAKFNGTSNTSLGSMSPGNMSSDNMCPGEVSPNPSNDDSVKAKRARVENIITSMRRSPSSCAPSSQIGLVQEIPRPKRKQAQPQQQKFTDVKSTETKQARRRERRCLKYLLSHLQQQLDFLSGRYVDLYEEDNSSLSDASDDLDDLNEPIDSLSAIQKCEIAQAKKSGQPAFRKDLNGLIQPESNQKLRHLLKQQLSHAVSTEVDAVIDRFSEVRRVTNNNNNNKPRSNLPKSSSPEMSNSVLQQAARNATLIVPVPTKRPHSQQQQQQQQLQQQQHLQQLHHHHHHNEQQKQQQQHNHHHQEVREQTEAISLVVPKRNRNKDHPEDNKQDHMMPTMLPTSVAIANPNLRNSLSSIMLAPQLPSFPSLPDKDMILDELRYAHSCSPLLNQHAHQQPSLGNHGGGECGDIPPHHLHGCGNGGGINEGSLYSFIKSEDNDSNVRDSPLSELSAYSPANSASLTSTLTPTHLRKAKLMFFYSRYPSSALLRQHFPDVKFNRHNTSQIIKWFSNFREFYYIQMEKFARQAMSDGVEKSEDLLVIRDMELFRTLNMHYNKSNEFQVPESFMQVATSTLREFFEAIKLGKDSEPSWKKTIYKIISKLDEPLPEFFKSANCLEEME